MSKKIAIGADHAGFELKEQLVRYLKEAGNIVIDKGTHSPERTDYPDYGHAVAEAVVSGEAETGVLLCGSGVGISISANRHRGVRAALCWKAEIAKLAREHNDANVLVLPARFISASEAQTCCKVFFETPFEGGRHEERVKKIELHQ